MPPNHRWLHLHLCICLDGPRSAISITDAGLCISTECTGHLHAIGVKKNAGVVYLTRGGSESNDNVLRSVYSFNLVLLNCMLIVCIVRTFDNAVSRACSSTLIVSNPSQSMARSKGGLFRSYGVLIPMRLTSNFRRSCVSSIRSRDNTDTSPPPVQRKTHASRKKRWVPWLCGTASTHNIIAVCCFLMRLASTVQRSTPLSTR